LRRIPVAVIGTNIGSTLHVRALQAVGFDVVALAGLNAERTTERASHFGIPLASTSVQEILESDIEAIVVATPPASHHPITMAAIAAGKHVLCEKPLAASSNLAAEMRDAAKAKGIVHVLQHQLRWRPSNAMLRRTIMEGALGKLIQGAFEFEFPMMQRPALDVPDWWLSPETGGGWLRNYNTHGIDLVRYMLGEFSAVSGRLHADLARGMTADDSYVINLVLANGMQGAMLGSCRTWHPHVQSRIIGSDATAILQTSDVLAGETFILADKSGTREIGPSMDLLGELNGRGIEKSEPRLGLPNMGDGEYQAVHAKNQTFIEQVRLCAAFQRRILDQTYTNPALADFDDGVAELCVIEAVEQAHREQRWIDVPSHA
jgi:predicted dehydrogenase